MGQYYS